MTNKPVLLGMNSPQSEDPAMALWPWNYAATGGRILRLLEEAAERRGWAFPPEAYVNGFDRFNVLNRKKWDRKLAIACAPFVLEALANRQVVLCGLEVLRVMGIPRHSWLTWRRTKWSNAVGVERELTYCVIPHPSGLTHYYNDPKKREAVGDMLLGLWISYHAPAAQSTSPYSPTS